MSDTTTSPNDAQVTPAMAEAAATLSRGNDGGGLFNLVALVGLLLVGAAAVARRRVARPGTGGSALLPQRHQ